MSNRRKIDQRSTMHVCPFCRTWAIEVPFNLPALNNEAPDFLAEHIKTECVPGVEVTFT